MVISIIQPCFIPWLGYFEQIAVCDIFVYMDDVQYTKKDWRNGNQMKSPNGVKNVSFSVKKTSRDTLIRDVEISYDQPWEETLFNQVTQWYKKAPYFSEIFNLITQPIMQRHSRLVDLNFTLNNAILNYLCISRPIHFTSAIPRRSSDKNGRVLEICKHFDGVDVLYDGKKAADFIDHELFATNGLAVIFQDYQHAPYRQLHGLFEPYMSIIDLLMNCGRGAKNILMSSPLPDRLKKTV